MANETIGHIRCPLGDGCTGEVREYSRGKRKRYWVCQHGMITPNLLEGQAYIEKHIVLIKQGEKTEPQPVPEPVTKPKPKARNWLSSLLEDDDE